MSTLYKSSLAAAIHNLKRGGGWGYITVNCSEDKSPTAQSLVGSDGSFDLVMAQTSVDSNLGRAGCLPSTLCI